MFEFRSRLRNSGLAGIILLGIVLGGCSSTEGSNSKGPTNPPPGSATAPKVDSGIPQDVESALTAEMKKNLDAYMSADTPEMSG